MGLAQSNLLPSPAANPAIAPMSMNAAAASFPAAWSTTTTCSQMAEQADRIEVREAGPHKIAASDVSAVLASLNALTWLDRGLVTDPATLRRAIRRKLGDQRARLRLKTGRNLLAGTITPRRGRPARTSPARRPCRPNCHELRLAAG